MNPSGLIGHDMTTKKERIDIHWVTVKTYQKKHPNPLLKSKKRLKQSFVCSSSFKEEFFLQSKINLSIKAEKIRDGINQVNVKTSIIHIGNMDEKIFDDVLIFLPSVASDIKLAETTQCPKIFRIKERTKNSPYLGHFRSLVIVKDGTEGRARASRRGQSGHVKRVIKPVPKIEIWSMIFAFLVISAPA